MGRDTPELAPDSLFIEKIQNAFEAADASLVKRAYTLTRQKISSLDTAPFKAAALIVDHSADAVTVSSALLAPLFWKGLVDTDEIRESVGQAVADTLRYLKPPFNLRVDTENHRRRDIHTLLASLAETPRKAFLLIVFRLIELEKALESPVENSRHIARETVHFYLPIANRLSLGELCRRLEDVCFHILEPAQYERLKREVFPIQVEDDGCLAILIEGVKRLLDKNRIHAATHGRTKSLYSIHRKMNLTGKPLEEIMDRIGLRIIVATVPECYAVLGLLHTHFRPIPGTFDDYIGLPKKNGYQSLHTCVYPVREISHKPIEFQVRTELMHKEAEHGSAAHWLYKSKAVTGQRVPTEDQWIKGIVRQHEQAKSTEEFIELLHRQVYKDHLVVFGRGGQITRLQDEATVLDYLNASNIRVSRGAVVKVNGEIAGMDRVLRDGDSVEVVDKKTTLNLDAAAG